MLLETGNFSRGGACYTIPDSWLGSLHLLRGDQGRGHPVHPRHRSAIRKVGIRANSILPGMMETQMVHAPRSSSLTAASPKRWFAGVTSSARWAEWAMPGTSRTPLCSSHPTRRNTSPALSWLSMVGSRSTASEHHFSRAASISGASGPTDEIQLDSRDSCEFRENSYRDSIREIPLNSHRHHSARRSGLSARHHRSSVHFAW